MEYVNYYNGENTSVKFEFRGMSKEEAERVQAYLLRDNKFYIDDEDALSKISEHEEEILSDKNYSKTDIIIRKDPNQKGHMTLEGYMTVVDGQQDRFEYNLSSNIYEGLNFIAIVSLLQDRQSCECQFQSINWCYEKSYKPDKLIRYDIKTSPIGGPGTTYDIIEYEVEPGFKITSNPTQVFSNNKKELRTLVK